jgi:hypothetical protein
MRSSMTSLFTFCSIPVRIAAAMARVQPAGPRTSASGLAMLRRRSLYSPRVAAIGSQLHVCRVGAAGEVDDAVLCHQCDAVFRLVGEQMRRQGPAS